MSAECKSTSCCPPEDFAPETDREGNCPDGLYWNGTNCIQCPIPTAPSLVLAANQITTNFNVAAGLAYMVERSTDMKMWVQLTTGTGGAGSETYVDGSVVAGTTYFYRIVVAVSVACGYISGEQASARAI